MASYNGKYGTQSVEPGANDYRPAPAKGGKMKAHFKRFWWLHLINFLVGTVIITMILVFVVMPVVSQKGINDARIELESQVVTSGTPDSVHVVMNTTSYSKNIYHPRLYPFEVSLFLEDTMPDIKPFGKLTIPQTQAEAVATIIVDQDMQIVDSEQFARYNKLVLFSEEYRVAMRGRVTLKEMAFPKTTVNFNKVITSKGLNNLKGFEVRNISISLIPDSDGTNMKGQVYINNPSPITITMGTVLQNVSVGDTNIGIATIPDLTLKPGANLVPMKSKSDQAAVISLITSKYPTGDLPVTIRGVSSTINGVDIPYFSQALQAQVLQTTLKLGPALKSIGLDVSALGGGGGGGGGSSSGNSSSSSSESSSSATSSAPAIDHSTMNMDHSSPAAPVVAAA